MLAHNAVYYFTWFSFPRESRDIVTREHLEFNQCAFHLHSWDPDFSLLRRSGLVISIGIGFFRYSRRANCLRHCPPVERIQSSAISGVIAWIPAADSPKTKVSTKKKGPALNWILITTYMPFNTLPDLLQYSASMQSFCVVCQRTKKSLSLRFFVCFSCRCYNILLLSSCYVRSSSFDFLLLFIQWRTLFF